MTPIRSQVPSMAAGVGWPLGIFMVGGRFLSRLVTLFTTTVIYLWLGHIQASGKSPTVARLAAKDVESETVPASHCR